MSGATWTPYHYLAVGLCLLVFVSTGLIAELVLERVPHLEDEVAYLFQAQVFASGKAYVPSPPNRSCFFAPFVLDHQGRRFGKYPPGWPALLAVGVRLGQAWWVNAAGAALTIALVFRLARAVHWPLVGGVAATLAASSPFVLLLAGSLMAHTWALVFITAFLWCYHRACTARNRQERWATASGVALGAAFAIRPFTAIAVALPAAAYALWRLVRRRDWRVVWFLALGFVPLALVVPLMNAVWTGDPLLSPYVLFWPYDRLGFGPGTGPAPGGNTLWLGLSGAVASIGLLSNHLLGWPALSLSFVVLLFLFRPRHPWDLFLLATALSLVLAYVVYWTSGDVFGPRYSYEAASALFVLAARGIVQVGHWARARRRLGVFCVVIGVLIAVNLFVYLPWQLRAYRGLYGITALPREVLADADLDNALVIVHAERGWWDSAVTFAMNAPTLDGDVVYANDCGPDNGSLIAQYPGRSVYYMRGGELRPYSSPPRTPP